MRLRTVPLALTITLLAAGTAMGQTGTTPPATPPATGGTTTGTPGGGSVPPGSYTPIDLPIEKPVAHAKAPPPPDPPPTPEPTPDPEPPEDPPPPEEPPELYGEELPTEDSIIYVLDSSGSMNWDVRSFVGLDGNTTSGSKLDRAKTEVIRSISNLTDDFRFNVVAFNCSTRQWASALQQATARNKAAAAGWVSSQTGLGATGTGPATALALSERENTTVVLLTDGSPNCGANGIPGHEAMILGSNQQGAKIHTFGISASGAFRKFLVDIASATGGRYVDVP